MDYLIAQKPTAVVATGGPFQQGAGGYFLHHPVFPDNIIAHINVNWLSPSSEDHPDRGLKKMLVWNDLDPDEKIKVYDKGGHQDEERVYKLLVSYRSGDMWAPSWSK